MGKPELNLHVDDELLALAQAAGISAQQVIEHALRVALSNAEGAEARAAKWAEENAVAIQAHREQIEKHGVFGEDFRTW
ncbi:MAG TPA: type II toxin-antitoxin system CcdA family antitoxin [Phenylobacterium sp.]|jgi:antitoxin CcdA|nr:type II toxin-antitoxin system CcdA family antitoxin [Phenylobacterium sp.]